MSAEQRDVYRNLLDMCWRDGSLPTDEKALRKMALAEPDEWRRSWPTVSKQFSERDGRLYHSKVESKRPAIVQSKQNRANGARLATAQRTGKRHDQRNGNRNGERDVDRNPPPSPSPSPEETKNVSSSPDAIFAALVRRHPKKTAPNYAATEFVAILETSQEPNATAVEIDAAHVRWCAYWHDTNTDSRFVPKLMDWLKGGDWTQDPPTPPDSEPEYPKPLM